MLELKSKGISPLIAIILLIAFTVGVGGIISLWLTGFTATQTSTVETSGERLVKCANSVLDIEAVYNTTFTPPKGSTDANGDFNVTVVYYSGTEDLYNFTISLTDNIGGVFTQSNTTKYVKNSSGTWAMNPGEKYTFILNFDENITESPITKARVSALCQDTFTVSREEDV